MGVVHAAHDIELDRDDGRQADARELPPCHADQRAIAVRCSDGLQPVVVHPMVPTARPSW
jgi:hypothetical protein